MIKAIFFDIDNTLVDFVNYKTKIMNKVIDVMIENGLQMDKKKAYDLLFKLYKKSYFESNHIIEDFLKETLGHIDYKLLGIAVYNYRKLRYKYVKPYKGVRQVLKELKEKNYILGIISDAPKTKAWIRLVTLKIMNYFSYVITLEDTNKRKPNIAPFKLALKKTNLKAEEILFIGDNPNRDIKGAKKIGMKTCLAKYGQFLKGNEKADYEINNIKDLLKIVK